ncbi:MAG: MFS transporter [Chloroflexi bacterium]|nr:MFS transporter [Chloroflexota bacterium]MCI0578992.1 MFS transporter [Chloroflexota bacterium]MCI0648986.1 MFS transporter [Chloroflexota bacterium]MCI0729421.1 MFS transporter [Chloroflexota bacterium]
MLAVLRQRNFALLWFGGLISLTGDWMLRIALPVTVFELTGSTLATGIMFMVGMVPNLLLGSVAGVFVDRWDRRRTMIATNLLLAAGLLPLLLLESAGWLWIVYVVAFVQSAVSQFFGPAENALLPQLVDESHLLTANSLNALNNNLARLIGPALGGFVAVAFDLAGVALVDAATFLLAALLIGLVRVAAPPAGAAQAPAQEKPAISFVAVWREWLAGLRLVGRERVVKILFAIAAIVAVGEGVISVLFVPFVTEVLRGKALQLGWLMSAQAVGGLLGGIIIARLGQRLEPRRLLGPSAVLFGLIDLAIFNYPAFIPGITLALVLFVLVGLPGAGFSASITTLLQNDVADDYRGRIFGALNTTFALLTLGGMGLASVAGDIVGIVPVINIQGYGFVLAGLLALVLLSPRGQSITAGRHSEA